MEKMGWHESRYNLKVAIPGTDNIAIANLYKGSIEEYKPFDLHFLSTFKDLEMDHPMLKLFAERGIICNFDEYAALEANARIAANGKKVDLTICPTMGCNFDCPYCFEDHRSSRMSEEVQNDIVDLVKRMLIVAPSKNITVTWFGGEPLLCSDIIESLTDRLMPLGGYTAGIITNGYLLTQDKVDLLERCRIKTAQITIDGIKETHDSTRHLAGGGATFDRIISNLRNKIPFKVLVRHNVHDGNKADVEKLKNLIESIARETGNNITYYPSPVSKNESSVRRGSQIVSLCHEDEIEIGIMQKKLKAGRGTYCGAHNLLSVGIDDKGNLFKCWESVDKPYLSFGSAKEWNPKDPIATASNPDNLTMFLNTACPPECKDCIWLPLCIGGCPYKVLTDKRQCLPFKDYPEKYVLYLYENKKAIAPTTTAYPNER